ncbi:PilW family protein [Desulfosediminicola ganghwensis]|uniref:PilW family protein n=1 Tax=Desulfosediminicola ganghwensis TaxID=2569540 RepID=UPI0010AD415B|nr:prepilin-type N-terminal cleavage/methylation domain-containing protein [Desulfosediminicola ganghwensis]
MNRRSRERGFTLVELLIAMAVGLMVMMAVFQIYAKQQDVYEAQLDVTEMQQNIRAAMKLLARDIRMAGYNGAELSTIGEGTGKIVQIKPDLIYFTIDRNEDGDVSDTDEHIAYDLKEDNGVLALRRTAANGTIDTEDKGSGHWEVKSGSGPVIVAERIEKIEFMYLDEDEKETSDEDLVKTVVVSIIARAEEPDSSFKNSFIYNPASNLAAYNKGTLSGDKWQFNDNYRRRFKIMTVDCRNLRL